ncbi:MAG: hypothetical protein PF505_05890 [Vallitaleaceae bacterium]|jgi:multisubunit Na+/H+ antiporter MnhG subunit|nr:hypothetical protein [Vallitaleaceae bacterium]
MLLKKLNLYIIIIAGTMVCVLGFLYEYTLTRLAYTLLIVLVVFYILTSVLQKIINKNIKEAETKRLEEKDIDQIADDINQPEENDTENINGESVSQKKT